MKPQRGGKVGIREKIETLPVSHYGLHNEEGLGEYVRRSQVLSILDEHLGECVAEYEFEATGVLKLVLKNKVERLICGLPGNRIAIYRREQ